MAAPAIRVLFLILVGQSILKRTPMQVECHDIGSRESTLWQVRQEQFIDHAFTGAPDPTWLLARRMSGYHDPAPSAFRADGHKRTVQGFAPLPLCAYRQQKGLLVDSGQA
jgi:hypothetical protein